MTVSPASDQFFKMVKPSIGWQDGLPALDIELLEEKAARSVKAQQPSHTQITLGDMWSSRAPKKRSIDEIDGDENPSDL
jgi:hypothetical protein